MLAQSAKGIRANRRIVGCRAASTAQPFAKLENALSVFKSAPQIMKQEESGGVLDAFKGLQQDGVIQKWGSCAGETLIRRPVAMSELKMVGVKDPGMIAVASVRNDMAFLVAVVGVTSVLAVAAGFLPGDWGFFVPYLTGGISIAVLAIGSTNPGILSFAIDKFSQVFPDYRQRVVNHEAAHFLLGYLLGVPITGYDLTIGKEHVDFAEAKLQKRLFQSQLESSDVDCLAVVSMAGIAAEAMYFEDIMGQQADLMDLQRILNRSSEKLSDRQQQDATRWAVWQACLLIRSHKKEFSALSEAMTAGKSVVDCVKVIEES